MTTNRCAGCRHSCLVDVGLEGEMLRACLYILQRGKKRPCPSGDGCTAYERRGEERRADDGAA